MPEAPPNRPWIFSVIAATAGSDDGVAIGMGCFRTAWTAVAFSTSNFG